VSYRDTATAIMQRAPGNFIGVVLYVPAGGQSTTPWWSAAAFPNSEALEEWYDEIAGSPPLYYYLSAFDKTRSISPVGESIAPPKPNMPGFNIHAEWRHPPFRRVPVTTSGAEPRNNWSDFAKGLALFAVFALPTGLLISKMKERQNLREEKASFRRLGLDWNKRFHY
jgi:hypothetical protein